MIYWNGNEYRTLDQKLYYGGTQIAKAYWGNQLVYPEKKNIVNNVEIKGFDTNGWIYDLGIGASRYTEVELCFENKNTNMNSEDFKGFCIFGTHHDIYYKWGGIYDENYNTNNFAFEYNPNGDGGSAERKNGSLTYKSMGDWGDGKSQNNCFNWKNQTSFHVICENYNGSPRTLIRYGGTAVQGDSSSLIEKTQNNFKFNVANWDYSKASDYDNIFSGLNLNQEINKTDNGNSINGKFFFIQMGQNRTEVGKGKCIIKQGIGNLFYGSDKLQGNSLISKTLNNNNNFAGSSQESVPTRSANLWIGTHNRNFSSTSDAVQPNKLRNHFTINGFNSINNSQTNFSLKTDCSDLNTERFKTGRFEWVYIMFQDKDGDNYRTMGGKPIKYLFLPFETEINDPYDNDKKIIGFKKYMYSNDGTTRDENPSEIILPFMWLNPD